VRVEVLGPDCVPEHDVIVEVDKVLGQPRDLVQVALDGRGAVRGQVGPILKYVLATKQTNVDHYRYQICPGNQTTKCQLL